MSKIIIGIMGPGNKATAKDLANAYEIGKKSAQKGYVTMTGARAMGVMDAALKGAKEAGGETLGILPNHTKDGASPYADILVITGMLSARNNINVLTSDVVIACGLEPGTLSEIALALKADKKVILLSENAKGNAFLSELAAGSLFLAATPDEAMAYVQKILETEN